MDDEERVRQKFEALCPVMDERMTRLCVAAEARALGRRGPTLVARAIVDGAKHLHLDRKQVDLKAVSTVLSRAEQRRAGKSFDMRPVFRVAGQNRDAFELCRKCVMRIRGFLAAHGRPVVHSRTVKDVHPDLQSVQDPGGTPWP